MLRSSLLLLVSVVLLAVSPDALRADSDVEDKAYLSVRIGQVLEVEKTGVKVEWSNPGTGNSGTIEVTRTYFVDGSKPCREYRRTTERAGEPPLVVAGTGCRIGDGRWRLSEAGRGATMSEEAAVPVEEVEEEPLPSSGKPEEVAGEEEEAAGEEEAAAEEVETAAADEVPRVVPPKPEVPVITDVSRPTRTD